MKLIYFILLLLSSLSSCKSKETVPVRNTPNIVLIVADDMGYSDLGCFGSEIATPNIDVLASQGQIFTSFYTAATCSPTRAMLITGTDNHIAGLGDMAERSISIDRERGQPGYEGYLNNRVVSVAQLLKEVGYHTYTAGKWHLGLTADQSPEAKGFERSFTLMDAAENHYFPSSQSTFWEDENFTRYPEGKYSTDFYTDKLISFLQKDHTDHKPFFLYAAYTAPHWPLQAPTEYIEKYHGTYDIGYDSLRILRFEGLKKKGIVDANVALPHLPTFEGDLYNVSDKPLRSWKSLSKNEQRIEARKMEIYAGMMDNLDHNIGRLIQYLKEIGEYENTLFVFFSDNGASSLDAASTPDDANPYPYMGTPNSFVAYGSSWAHASSAVNSFYKGYSSEGGIHTPMIVKMPNQKEGKGLVNAFTTVMDMTPTFLDLAEVKYPSTYKGRTITPLKGASILPMLNNQKENVHDEEYVMGWELFGRCALRKGKWKITKIEAPFGKGDFQLFNLEEDPTEANDVSAKFPDKYQELLVHWNEYVKENGVILLEK